MTIVRWEPFRDLGSVQERMSRIVEEAFRGVPRALVDDATQGGAWAPAVDIYEHDGNLVLKAELPGIEPKDVDVRVEDRVLTLRGERNLESEVKREKYQRMERSYGTFSRSFRLPSMVDHEQIKAEFKDGVLRVTLPQREEAKPKQISISVSQ